MTLSTLAYALLTATLALWTLGAVVPALIDNAAPAAMERN